MSALGAMLQLLATLPLSNENGLARTPPLGWRSWNTFGADVNQSLIEGIMDGMVKKSACHTLVPLLSPDPSVLQNCRTSLLRSHPPPVLSLYLLLLRALTLPGRWCRSPDGRW